MYIVLRAAVLNQESTGEGHVTAIDTLESGSDASHAILEVPQELLNMFAHNETGIVRVTSSVLSNVTELFPDGLSTRNE